MAEEQTPHHITLPQSLILDEIENCWPQWQRFKLAFKVFLLAAGYEKLSEARKAALLLNCIGPQAQELYFNVLKTDEEKVKLTELIKIFDEYFQPKQNEVINSYTFNKRNQEEGELFDTFYSSIRKIAQNCNYGDKQDRMLRDRIVIGVREQRTQQKLLEIKDLSLSKAVDICRSAELSREQVKVLNKTEVQAVKADRTSQQLASTHSKAKYSSSKNRPQSSNNRSLYTKYSNNNNNKIEFNKNHYRCKKCNTDHGPRQCPAYGKICNKCKKLNHFSVGCRSLSKQVHNISDENNKVHDL